MSRTPQAELNILNKKFDILKSENELTKKDNEIIERRLVETEKDLRDCEEKLSTEIKRCSDLEHGIAGLPEARV